MFVRSLRYKRCVLLELRVENLVLIQRAELRLGPGLNVLTGETGAGKTMLASALDLLLGGRSRQSLVRAGASEAYVEGIFELTPTLRAQLEGRIPGDAEELVLARRVTAEGRTRAYIAGRSVTAGELREVAEGLVAFTGQHEHRRLVDPRAQLELVDGAGGKRVAALRERAAKAHERVREAKEKLAELDDREAERERRVDVARFELEEIERVAPEPGEAEELSGQRERLWYVERLRAAAAAGAEAVDSDDLESSGIGVVAATALAELEGAERVDERLDPLIERFRVATIEFQDLGTELRSYLSDLEADPVALEAVERRLAELDRVLRKYGGSTEDVLAHGERCALLLEELGDVDAARERLEGALAEARTEQREICASLTEARAKAATKLGAGVGERLARLAMESAHFEITINPAEPGPTGADSAEFVLRANPGAPAAPLREVASGGELSRVLLALVGAAGGGPDTSYVLDEIDAGIGGRTAAALGTELQHLAGGRQVVCITHLPQVAAVASHHARIVKEIRGGETRTTIEPLVGEGVTTELVRMLGAADGDEAAVHHAERLRTAALAGAAQEQSAA